MSAGAISLREAAVRSLTPFLGGHVGAGTQDNAPGRTWILLQGAIAHHLRNQSMHCLA